MPYYSYLREDLRCPACHQVITDLFLFQWGFTPGRGESDDYLYHLGDRIFWRQCLDTSIPSWAYFKEGDTRRGANLGDPAIENLFVQDAAQFYWEEPAQRRRCEQCGASLEGAALEIRDNVLTRAWIYQPGEFDHAVDIVIIGPDGGLKPMPEWNDHYLSPVTLPCGDAP